MCTLGVSNSVLKHFGVEFVSEHVLPLLTPVLIAQQLNVQQFAKYMLFVKDVLRKIEEKRGGTVTDSGNPEVKQASVANGDGLQSQAISKTSVASAKGSKSWEDEWAPPLASIPSQPSTGSAISSQQTSNSCPAVDIEWPPRASSDPFANWPSRPSSSPSGPGALANGTVRPPVNYESSLMSNTQDTINFEGKSSNIWALNNQSSVEPLRTNQGSSTLNPSMSNSGILNPQNSIGLMKRNQGISFPIGSSYNDKKSADLGSIFSSTKNEQAAPKLTPPPSTAVGRGRGRGRGSSSTSRMSNPKPTTSKQPPLLDLL
ncbi:hypothetical protein SLE2022_327180 [Rubroshorea leprosula]